MPVNKKMMSRLKKEYGVLKGEKIYYAIENERIHQKKKKR